jgi:hypothetical protein
LAAQNDRFGWQRICEYSSTARCQHIRVGVWKREKGERGEEVCVKMGVEGVWRVRWEG